MLWSLFSRSVPQPKSPGTGQADSIPVAGDHLVPVSSLPGMSSFQSVFFNTYVEKASLHFSDFFGLHRFVLKLWLEFSYKLPVATSKGQP